MHTLGYACTPKGLETIWRRNFVLSYYKKKLVLQMSWQTYESDQHRVMRTKETASTKGWTQTQDGNHIL